MSPEIWCSTDGWMGRWMDRQTDQQTDEKSGIQRWVSNLKMSVTENLTAERMQNVQRLREKHRFKNIWTQDGKILFWDIVSDWFKLYYN